MKTIIVAPFDMFYAAFVKCLVLHEYKSQIEISLCGFFADSIEHKICCNILKDKSIDVSHVHTVKANELQENYNYSNDDWEFIMQHEIVECATYDRCFEELLQRKQPHQFVSAHFENNSFNNFPTYSPLVDIICMRTSSEVFNKNYADILQYCFNTLITRITENKTILIFQNHKNVSEQLVRECEDEYLFGYCTIFAHILHETKNMVLAKHFANNVTRSILNTMDIRSYKKFRGLV
ncbi:MAG: hypothetical protein FWC39_12545 [Bacteroidetes bacterium]|nr:hypothetical protein [Bacteroidota bacterium]